MAEEFKRETYVWGEDCPPVRICPGVARIDTDGTRWEYFSTDELMALPAGAAGGVIFTFRRQD